MSDVYVVDEETGEEFAITKADERVLARLGDERQRRAALTVLGQALGIPSRAFDDPRTGVHGALTRAIQFVGEYAFVPGEDFHAVPRYTNVAPKSAPPEWLEVWTIQLGEKAWKKSAHRHGVEWEFEVKPMTPAEVAQELDTMGVPANQRNPHAVGWWARVVTERMVKWNLDRGPYSAGLWFGSILQGSKWHDDRIPTGTTASDVALRRAHKKAIMRSSLSLQPLDERTPDERYTALVENLRDTVEENERINQVPDSYDKTDDQGLFAMPNPQEQAAAAVREEKNQGPEDGVWTYMEEDDLAKWEEAVAAPYKWHTIPVNHPIFEEYPNVPALLARMMRLRRQSGPTLSKMKVLDTNPPANRKNSDRQLWAMAVGNAIKAAADTMGVEASKDQLEAMRHTMYDALCGYSVADNDDRIPASYNDARLWLWEGGSKHDPQFAAAFHELAIMIVNREFPI